MPFAAFNADRYFFRESGSSEAGCPAVVFVHGSGGDSSVWQCQETELAGAGRLIMPDLPGHGVTGGSPCRSIEEYCRSLFECISAMGLKRFMLAGHSLGGMVAQEYARQHPGSIAGLVLAGTAVKISVSPEYMAVLKTDFPRAVKISCDNAYAPGVSGEIYRRGHDMVFGNGHETYASDITACAAFDSSGWIDTLQLPCLVICGKHDTITPPACSQALHRAVRGSWLHVLGRAGHLVMQEAADEFNGIVKDFIHKIFT